jgi:hypothetical protein
VAGILVTSQVVKDRIYVGDDKTERHSESFYTTVKLAFTTTIVKTGEAPLCFQNPKLAVSFKTPSYLRPVSVALAIQE